MLLNTHLVACVYLFMSYVHVAQGEEVTLISSYSLGGLCYWITEHTFT